MVKKKRFLLTLGIAIVMLTACTQKDVQQEDITAPTKIITEESIKENIDRETEVTETFEDAITIEERDMGESAPNKNEETTDKFVVENATEVEYNNIETQAASEPAYVEEWAPVEYETERDN